MDKKIIFLGLWFSSLYIFPKLGKFIKISSPNSLNVICAESKEITTFSFPKNSITIYSRNVSNGLQIYRSVSYANHIAKVINSDINVYLLLSLKPGTDIETLIPIMGKNIKILIDFGRSLTSKAYFKNKSSDMFIMCKDKNDYVSTGSLENIYETISVLNTALNDKLADSIGSDTYMQLRNFLHIVAKNNIQAVL